MNSHSPMSQAEFDQCCGQCLAGVALDHYGAMESVVRDRVCENCPLVSPRCDLSAEASAKAEASSGAPASERALREARAQ